MANYHPSRISGQAKRERERAVNSLVKRKKRPFQKIELGKQGLVKGEKYA